MKTLLLIIGVIIVSSMRIVAQNYMGMSQSKIISGMGEPDRVGENYFVYNDLNETGQNVYYFDNKGNCSSFEIIRRVSYLKQYKRMLKTDFNEAGDNKYEKKTRKIHYCAELQVMKETFQIKVHHADEQIIESRNPLVAGM